MSSGTGLLVDNGNGTWTYTPALNDDTSVSFSYTITDNGTTNGVADPKSVSGSASLDITPVNDAPVTTPVTLAPIAEDSGARIITQAQLLANASDVENNTLTASNLQIVSGTGLLVDNGDGTWTYTPALNDDTSVSFSYTITDNGTTNGVADPKSVSGSASLDITPVNDAPVITAVSLTVSEGGTVLVTPASIGVIDPDSSSFTFTASNVSHGTFQTTTDGVTWVDTTTFTSADVSAGHVRFAQDGSLVAPTFSIQADDGSAVNNLSNVFVGSVGLAPGIPGVIYGDVHDNTLTGTPGNDVFQGFGGDDSINGLGGFDRALYTDATGGITVNLAAGTVSGAGVGNDTLVAIEGIVGSDFADTFNAAGFTGSTSVPGTPVGFNEFEGRGGNDTIISAVNGFGAALTRVSYVSATAGVTVDIAAGTADGDASVGHDTFVGSGILSAWGSAFADTLERQQQWIRHHRSICGLRR